jgi:hypothetical protein
MMLLKNKGKYREVQLKEVGGKPWPGRTEIAYRIVLADELAKKKAKSTTARTLRGKCG